MDTLHVTKKDDKKMYADYCTIPNNSKVYVQYDSCLKKANHSQVVISHTCKVNILYINVAGYEKVYFPLCQVADTPFHLQQT